MALTLYCKIKGDNIGSVRHAKEELLIQYPGIKQSATAMTRYCYGTDLIAKDGTKVCHGYDPK